MWQRDTCISFDCIMWLASCIMVWILHQNKFLNFLNPSNNTNNDMRFCYFNIDLRVFLEFFLSDEHINNQNCSRSFFKKFMYIRKIKNLCIITLHPWSLYFEHRINWSNIPYLSGITYDSALCLTWAHKNCHSLPIF